MRYVRPLVTVAASFGVLSGLLLGALGVARAVGGDSGTLYYITGGVVLVGLGLLAFVTLTKDPSRRSALPADAQRATGTLHLLTFDVGDYEKHTVLFRFDQMWGWLTISIDDVMIVKKLVGLSLRLVTTFTFRVGKNEVHTVRIEKYRPLIGSFARPQPIKGFIDGVLVAESDGIGSA